MLSLDATRLAVVAVLVAAVGVYVAANFFGATGALAALVGLAATGALLSWRVRRHPA